MSERFWGLLVNIQRSLRAADGKGKQHESVNVANGVLGNFLPHYWKEECPTQEEWFIRHCRSIGLHATYDLGKNNFAVRLTRDAADEAMITWPGKDLPARGKRWAHDRTDIERPHGDAEKERS